MTCLKILNRGVPGENSVTLASRGFCALLLVAYFHDLVTIGGRFYVDGREA